MTTASESEAREVDLPIDQVHPSKLNPRRSYDPVELHRALLDQAEVACRNVAGTLLAHFEAEIAECDGWEKAASEWKSAANKLGDALDTARAEITRLSQTIEAQHEEIRALFKWLPKSAEMAKAEVIDDAVTTSDLHGVLHEDARAALEAAGATVEDADIAEESADAPTREPGEDDGLT
jgi:prophage DNA circulation protein